MNWVTWRQHRTEAIVIGILWVLLIPLLLITGVDLASGTSVDIVHRIDALTIPFLIPIFLLPMLLGMFVGAPLVAREIEQGTYRFAWTQGITRQAWLRTKLGLVAGITLGLFALLALIFAWWNIPVNASIGPWRTYDTQGPVVVAYALFGLALGTALGSLLGKTVPAMALTIPIFLALRGGMIFLRQVFLPPLSGIWDYTGSNPRTLDWVLQQGYVDKLGHALDFTTIKTCQDIGSTKQGITACFQANGIFLQTIYQPASRFWTFQAIETIIFLALAAGLAVLTFWLVTRQGE